MGPQHVELSTASGRATVQRPKRTLPPANVLIDRLFEFEADRIRKVLKEVDLPIIGNLAELRNLIEQGVESKQLTLEALADQILLWEPWTHRHCYFFETNKEAVTAIRDPETFEARIMEAQCFDLLGPNNSFYIPDSLGVNSIDVKNQKLVVTLVAKRTYLASCNIPPQFDQTSGILWHPKIQKETRKMYVMELNLRTGKGFVSIPIVKQGTKYGEDFLKVEKIIRKIFTLGQFEIMKLDGTISGLTKDKDHTVSHELDVLFADGPRMQLKASKKGQPIFNGKSNKPLEKVVNNAHQSEAAFYLLDKNGKPDFRFKIFADGRLGVFTDLEEMEFRNVMDHVLGFL